MFSEGGFYMVFGILLGLVIIFGSSVYGVHKMFKGSTQEILVKFILMIFSYYFGTKSDKKE